MKEEKLGYTYSVDSMMIVKKKDACDVSFAKIRMGSMWLITFLLLSASPTSTTLQILDTLTLFYFEN